MYEVQVLFQSHLLSIAPLRTKWGGREWGHPFGSMLQREGYGGKSGQPSVRTERSQCTGPHTGAALESPYFLKQDNLQVSYLLVLSCFGGNLKFVQMYCFIKYTEEKPQHFYVVSSLLLVFSVYLAQLLCLAPFRLQRKICSLCWNADLLMTQSCSHWNHRDPCCWLWIWKIRWTWRYSRSSILFLSVKYEYQACR